jgi:pimeloyl-ACP methyl ester carboxylesterase
MAIFTFCKSNTMAYDIIQEGKFSYIEEGTGEPLVLLHGLFGALSNFSDLFNHFKDKYRVIIPMLPLYDLPIIKTGVSSLAKYVHEFIEYKDLKNITLLGNSLGGHISLVYYTKWPERVHSMVLTGSSGLYENAFGSQYPRKGDKEYLREKAAKTFYDPKHVTDDLVEELFEVINDRNKLIRILAIAKSAIRHNMAEDLPKFKIPVCLIWGKQDNVTPPEVATEFNTLLPNSELFWIDKCGHAPMMEHPEEFNTILAPWLAKIKG